MAYLNFDPSKGLTTLDKPMWKPNKSLAEYDALRSKLFDVYSPLVKTYKTAEKVGKKIGANTEAPLTRLATYLTNTYAASPIMQGGAQQLPWEGALKSVGVDTSEIQGKIKQAQEDATAKANEAADPGNKLMGKIQAALAFKSTYAPMFKEGTTEEAGSILDQVLDDISSGAYDSYIATSLMEDWAVDLADPTVNWKTRLAGENDPGW